MVRFIGIVNAAIWVGAAFFFTVFASPAFFSTETLALFGGPGVVARYYAGSMEQILLDRYFMLLTGCAVIALVLLVAEWIFTGRPFQTKSLYLAVALLAFVLLEAYGLGPKLQQAHCKSYGVGVRVTYAQAEKARQNLGVWHGLSQIMNVVLLGGTLVYLWQVSQPLPSVRFVNNPPVQNQFRV